MGGRPCNGDSLLALFALAAAPAKDPVVAAIGAVFAGQVPVRVVPVIKTGLAIGEAINPVAEPFGEMAAACRHNRSVRPAIFETRFMVIKSSAEPIANCSVSDDSRVGIASPTESGSRHFRKCPRRRRSIDYAGETVCAIERPSPAGISYRECPIADFGAAVFADSIRGDQ